MQNRRDDNLANLLSDRWHHSSQHTNIESLFVLVCIERKRIAIDELFARDDLSLWFSLFEWTCDWMVYLQYVHKHTSFTVSSMGLPLSSEPHRLFDHIWRASDRICSFPGNSECDQSNTHHRSMGSRNIHRWWIYSMYWSRGTSTLHRGRWSLERLPRLNRYFCSLPSEWMSWAVGKCKVSSLGERRLERTRVESWMRTISVRFLHILFLF